MCLNNIRTTLLLNQFSFTLSANFFAFINFFTFFFSIFLRRFFNFLLTLKIFRDIFCFTLNSVDLNCYLWEPSRKRSMHLKRATNASLKNFLRIEKSVNLCFPKSFLLLLILQCVRILVILLSVIIIGKISAWFRDIRFAT